MVQNAKPIVRAAIIGALCGIFMLPLIPMLNQLLPADFDRSTLNVRFLAELVASYLFLLSAGAPFTVLVGAATGVVAYTRLKSALSTFRLFVEAVVAGGLCGGGLAALFSAIGFGSRGTIGFVILPLSGAAFALAVLAVLHNRFGAVGGLPSHDGPGN